MRLALAFVAVLASGCGVRAAPYRFAGPLVSSVNLDDHAGLRGGGGDPGPRRAPSRSSEVRTELPGAFAETGARSEVLGGAYSELPAPHREEAPVELDTVRTPEALRALTGRRDDRGNVAFAIEAAAAFGAPALDAADGPALVALARERGTLGDADAPITPGALLVFDRAVDDAPASLVAVAIAVDERGVVEMLYLARGVVRRGFVDPARPSTKRDADGRIVNTFLRHTRDQPPRGTRYLAGELLAHVITW